MANEEHVQRLKQGVDAWNTWWQRHHEIWIDLREADLEGADLKEAVAYPRPADIV